LNPQQNQSGFSLIELLIAMVLSLFFVGGAIAYLISSRTMVNLQDSSSRIQENALYVLDEMVSSIRMAGYYNLLSPGAQIPAGQFYTGVCGNFDPCTADGTQEINNYSDRIAVMLNPPEDDGTDADCIGNAIHSDPVIATSAVVANLYHVENRAGVNTLVCESFLISKAGSAISITPTPYELVGGIDSLQILYGVTDMADIAEIDTTINRYISATTLSATQPPVGATSPWVDVATVRLAILSASGFSDKSSTHASEDFNVLDAQTFTKTDRNLRKLYTSTVLINNSRI